VGADVGGTTPTLDALADLLGDSRTLFLLDNAEQLVDVGGDLDELLDRCPGLSILTTSRTVLGLRAEREYPVSPLPPPADPWEGPSEELLVSPAVALFVDRTRAVHHDFVLNGDNGPAVAEICRRLEGLPLAIELAAARTRLLTPEALLNRLSQSLDALGAGPADLPARQRTLRATVDWSIGLLDDAERSMLEVAAVFAGGWTIPAAAESADIEEDSALSLNETLARHSSLGPRPRMLDTIREFVAERLAARPDLEEIERRHAERYYWLAQETERPLRRQRWNEWAQQLQIERANVASAARWYVANQPAQSPHLFRALLPLWTLRIEDLSEARALVEQLLPLSSTMDPQTQVELLLASTVTATESFGGGQMLTADERLVALLDSLNEPYLHAVSRVAIAWTTAVGADVASALRDATLAMDEL
jgi:predicted ATPase